MSVTKQVFDFKNIKSSILAMWSRAYLHSGVMNGVTTGKGGVKRRFADAQQSSSHIVCTRIQMIEVFVHSPSSNHQSVSSCL